MRLTTHFLQGAERAPQPHRHTGVLQRVLTGIMLPDGASLPLNTLKISVCFLLPHLGKYNGKNRKDDFKR